MLVWLGGILWFLMGYFYSKWEDHKKIKEINKVAGECIRITNEIKEHLLKENERQKNKIDEN